MGTHGSALTESETPRFTRKRHAAGQHRSSSVLRARGEPGRKLCMALNIVVPQPGAAGPSLPFEYEHNSATRLYLVKLAERPDGSPIILKSPSLKFVREMWPIGVRRMAGGRYYATARRGDKSVPLHRIFVGALEGERVRAWDGDYLNFGQHVRKKVIVSPNGTRYEYPGTVRNVYVAGRENVTPNDERLQSRFDRMGRYPVYATEEGVEVLFEPGAEIQKPIALDNIGARTMCFGRIVDCGPVHDYHNDSPTVDTVWTTRTKPEIESIVAQRRRIRRARSVPQEVLTLATKWGLDTDLY